MTVIDDIAGAAMESEANEVQEVKLNESARQSRGFGARERNRAMAMAVVATACIMEAGAPRLGPFASSAFSE